MSDESKETISFRLSPTDRKAIDALASSMDRSRSDLINDAIRSFLDVQQWQIDEISRALIEAENNDFASEQEVKALFKKLTK